MIRKVAVTTAILFPGVVLAQVTPRIPSSCQTAYAHQIETRNIQVLVYPGPGEPWIVHIQSADNAKAKPTSYGGKMLVCHVNVSWSSGRLDSGYRFAIWGGPTGKARVSYGPEGVPY